MHFMRIRCLRTLTDTGFYQIQMIKTNQQPVRTIVILAIIVVVFNAIYTQFPFKYHRLTFIYDLVFTAPLWLPHVLFSYSLIKGDRTAFIVLAVLFPLAHLWGAIDVSH